MQAVLSGLRTIICMGVAFLVWYVLVVIVKTPQTLLGVLENFDADRGLRHVGRANRLYRDRLDDVPLFRRHKAEALTMHGFERRHDGRDAPKIHL